MIRNKNYVNILVYISLILVILFFTLASFSYAFYSHEEIIESTTKTVVANVSCLKLNIVDNNNLAFSSSTPVQDSYAINNLTPLTYEITNLCTNSIRYNLGLSSLSNNDNNHVLDSQMKINVTKQVGTSSSNIIINSKYLNTITKFENGISTNYIVGVINNDNVLSGYANRESYVIDSSEISSNVKNTYNILLWLSSEAGSDALNKYFKSFLSLIENGEEYSSQTIPEGTMNFEGDTSGGSLSVTSDQITSSVDSSSYTSMTFDCVNSTNQTITRLEFKITYTKNGNDSFQSDLTLTYNGANPITSSTTISGNKNNAIITWTFNNLNIQSGFDFSLSPQTMKKGSISNVEIIAYFD